MADVRPLRELLTDLVGSADTHADGPAEYLAAHGYDLPPDLVAEAVVNYADTAPPEVAEHLAPFVTAHTTGVEPESDWFDLLTTTPTPEDTPSWATDLDSDPDADLDGLDHDHGFDFGSGAVDDLDMLATEHDPVATESHHDWTEPATPTPDPEPAVSADDLDEDEDDLDEDEDDLDD
jgi:hypothetical protein